MDAKDRGNTDRHGNGIAPEKPLGIAYPHHAGGLHFQIPSIKRCFATDRRRPATECLSPLLNREWKDQPAGNTAAMGIHHPDAGNRPYATMSCMPSWYNF